MGLPVFIIVIFIEPAGWLIGYLKTFVAIVYYEFTLPQIPVGKLFIDFPLIKTV